MPFSALLDTNVLVPLSLCDTLLRVAAADLYRPLWSFDVLQELIDTLVEVHPEHPRPLLARRVTAMQAAFPDAEVTGYQELAGALVLPDPDDRHVLAAAITGRADVIVTVNRRDFPFDACDPHGIDVQTPDEFLVYACDLAPVVMLAIIEEQASDLTHPPLRTDELLDRLERHAPDFVAKLYELVPRPVPPRSDDDLVLRMEGGEVRVRRAPDNPGGPPRNPRF